MYFGGVEGGASHSLLILCNENGDTIAKVTGPGTNHWMIGISECAKRIAEMTNKAKNEAGIPLIKQLSSLGLSLSGCEQELTNKQLETELKTIYPDVAINYYVCSDTLGSIFTVSPLGGLVVISGTGSNAMLRNTNGTNFNCGGWGHFLGDEGSAFWISHRALKIVFDDMDNFIEAPYPIDRVWDVAAKHFAIKTRFDLLDHCYAKFDKPFFARLCQKLAVIAEEGDLLAQHLFKEAGRLLARSVCVLLPKVEESLIKAGNLRIACVGSVWLSWHLLSEGFVQELNRHPHKFNLQLVKLNVSMAYGACYLGADSIQFELPRTYDNNFIILYHYIAEKSSNNKKTCDCKNGKNK